MTASRPHADPAPMLFLHGGGVAGWMWQPVLAGLDDGARPIVPDLPGHGGPADASAYSSHDETVEGLARRLEVEDRPATVIGFSLGAQLAILLASRRPDLVDRVIAISAQAVPLRHPGPLLALLSSTAGLARREWFARAQARALFVPESLTGEYLRTSASLSRSTLISSVGENVRFEPPAAWPDFPGEALLLVGEREKPLMRRSAERLRVLRPASGLEIVPGCGHGIPLQRPEWLARRIARR